MRSAEGNAVVEKLMGTAHLPLGIVSIAKAA